MPTKKANKTKDEAVEGTTEETPEVEAGQEAPDSETDVAGGEQTQGPDHTVEELRAWAASLAEFEDQLKNWEADLNEREKALKARPVTSDAPPALPEEELTRAREMIGFWVSKGRDENAFAIRSAIEAGKYPPNRLMSVGVVKPQKDVRVSESDIPPRNGKGSDARSWVKFAKMVSRTDESVLERMSRDDIINLLEVEEIIPKEPAKEN